MRETQSMISRLLSSFAVVSSISAFVVDNPLQLLQPSAGVNNTTIITTTNNKNILPLLSLPPSPNPTSNFPTAGLVSYVCNGDAFGHDLNVDSCTDAIRFLGVQTTQLSFGMRNTGAFDIRLPQRYISSDGKCAIEPTLAPDKELARASAEDVAVAAFVVVRNCAAKQGGKGGIAKDIGASGLFPWLVFSLSSVLLPPSSFHFHTYRISAKAVLQRDVMRCDASSILRSTL